VKHARPTIGLAVSLSIIACGSPSHPGDVPDGGNSQVADAAPRVDALPPQGLLFFDDFEYAADRGGANTADAFRSAGWFGVKTEPDAQGGANGYVYTASSIPGYAGAFPGLNSDHALVLEAKPRTLNAQTDFWLQYGGQMVDIGFIPPNHWYQFWIYSPNTAPEQSGYTQGKFIYPTRTWYPATLQNEGAVYVMTLHKPVDNGACVNDRPTPCLLAAYSTKWNNTGGLTNNLPDGSDLLWQNLSAETPITPEQWTLVKVHVDLTGTDPRATPGQAVYEQWIRRMGSPSWIKTTEWIGGVTVNEGAPVNLTPPYSDGFRTIRMPTTTGGTNSGIGDWVDYWLYVDDFALSDNEEALPVYP